MPLHAVETPEALLARHERQTLGGTCSGITGTGRRCRRQKVKLAIGGTQAQYCWQHNPEANLSDHAALTAPTSTARRKTSPSEEQAQLRARSSIETFIQRLGITSVTNDRIRPAYGPDAPREHRHASGAEARSSSPRVRSHRDGRANEAEKAPRPVRNPQSERYKRRPGFWELLCCLSDTADADDYMEVVRHRKRTEQVGTSVPRNQTISVEQATRPKFDSGPAIELPYRPRLRPRTSSKSGTRALLSLLPEDLKPQTTAALLSELSKPISPHDEEGYIYIYWLTPSEQEAPPLSAAQSLLTSSRERPSHARRVSDVMTEYSFQGLEPATKGRNTIMLKIGRASNVTRRMREWQKQCGYQLSLVRWYPYHAQAAPEILRSRSGQRSSHGSPPSTYDDEPRTTRHDNTQLRKVPCVKRVERLIHIELMEHLVKRKCSACGREHREWFEVEASQAGVTTIDACVKRWVNWALEGTFEA